MQSELPFYVAKMLDYLWSFADTMHVLFNFIIHTEMCTSRWYHLIKRDV